MPRPPSLPDDETTRVALDARADEILGHPSVASPGHPSATVNQGRAVVAQFDAAAFDREFPGLDPRIRRAVRLLRARDVEKFESCEGGDGHAYAEPTVRFYGHRDAGWHALLQVALQHGRPADELRRTWPVIDREPTGPYWELVFRERLG